MRSGGAAIRALLSRPGLLQCDGDANFGHVWRVAYDLLRWAVASRLLIRSSAFHSPAVRRGMTPPPSRLPGKDVEMVNPKADPQIRALRAADAEAVAVMQSLPGFYRNTLRLP